MSDRAPLFSLSTNPLAVEAAERQRVGALQRGLLLPWQTAPHTSWFAGEQFGPGVVASSRRPPDLAQLRGMLVNFDPDELSRIDGAAALTTIVRALLFHMTHLVSSVSIQQRDLVAHLVADVRAQSITRKDVHEGMARSYERWPDRAPDLPPFPTPPILAQLDDGLCVRHGVEKPEQGYARQKSRLPKTTAEWARAASEVSNQLSFKNLADLEHTILTLATALIITAENERAVGMILQCAQQLTPAIHVVQGILDGNHHPEARAILEQAAQYRHVIVRSKDVISQHNEVPQLPRDYMRLLREQRHIIGDTLIPAMHVLFTAAEHVRNLENAIAHMEGHTLQNAHDLAARAPKSLVIDAASTVLRIPATQADIPEHWGDSEPLLMLA